MAIRGDTSNTVKDLLRSMLHAWYDLTREEAGAWTNHLEAEVALQQEMRQPVRRRPPVVVVVVVVHNTHPPSCCRLCVH